MMCDKNRGRITRLTPQEMRSKLEGGFSHDEFCRLLYAQLDSGPEGR